MSYQGVVLPILLGVGLAVAAVYYFLQGDTHSPQCNRPHNNGRQPQCERGSGTNSWELSNSNNKPKCKQSVQAEQPKCSVCYEDLKGDLKMLQCKHKFHVDCITRWLREKKNCPLCRQSATM